MKSSDVEDRLLDFAARVGKMVDALPAKKKLARHIANQLVRCSSSPGAMYEEAHGAESKADFIHKLSVGLKELRESHYWLRLTVKSQFLPPRRMERLVDEASQLCRILAKSVVTAKRKLGAVPAESSFSHSNGAQSNI
jgi:four helix bundle protein